MEQRTIKTMSITLSMLVIATMIPMAEAANTTEGKIGENTTPSSTRYYMVGIIRLHYEVIVDYWFIYGFRVITVLCIEYQDENPGDFSLMGPRYYIDFDDFSFEGELGPFFICGMLRER